MNVFLKKVAMAVIVILSTTVASAQTAQEVVYLKNGSVIRGVVIEQIPNESLKIQTADGSVFAYKMSEVEKITKEQAVSRRSVGGSGYDTGWNELSFGIGFGKSYYTGNDYDGDEDLYLFSFNYARGIHLSRDNGLTLRPGVGILVGHQSVEADFDYDDLKTTFVSLTPKIDFGYHVIWPSSSISIFPYIGLAARMNVWGQIDYDDETWDLFDSDEGDANRFQVGYRIGFDAYFNKFALGLAYEHDLSEFSEKTKVWAINLKLGWTF